MDLKLPDLAIGETYRGRCPACHRPSTFSVTRLSNSLVYNCYAASCGLRGRKGTALTADDMRQRYSREQPETPTPRPLPSFTHHEHVTRLCEAHGITPEDVAYDPLRGRVVFILRDLRGRAIDAIGRTVRGDLPKWLRYSDSKAPVVVGDGRWLILVEDIVSARKACQACPAAASMALLGTSRSTEHLMRASQFDQVFICLDKDATDKAVAIHRRLSAFVDRCVVVMLSSDIKDMQDRDIRELFIYTSNQGVMR